MASCKAGYISSFVTRYGHVDNESRLRFVKETQISSVLAVFYILTHAPST